MRCTHHLNYTKMARKTLAEQIALLGQAKTDYDIENNELENNFDQSGSDVLDQSDDEQARDHYVKVSKSKLRKPTSAIRGKKYNGEVISRDDLYNDADEGHDDSDNEISQDESEEDEEDGEGELEDDVSGEESDSGASLRSNSDEEAEDSQEEALEEEEDVSADAKRSRIKQILAHERKHIVNRLSESATNDALKGYAVLQQQKEFDSLIDLRLKIQKALTSSNLLPIDKETLENTDLQSKKSSKYIQEATDKCFDLLDTIFALRSQLYTKEKIVLEELVAKPAKRTLADYMNATVKYDGVLNKYRGSVLTKWLAKIQNSSGSSAMNANKFKALNQSAEQQVTNNLYDMDRLLKRTKLNRRQIKPLGHEYNEQQNATNAEDERGEEEEEEYEKNAKPTRSVNFQEMDLIFDDEDFYRVLLNDLVDKKIQSADPTSGLQFALKGAASTKLKKNVDNKASKGRKLRYHVQEKIANFDSPRPWLKWNDSQVDEFFASLLGQKISMREDSSEDEDEDDEDEEEVIAADSGIKLFG
ncbi:hypothetical protein PUMCH_001002 [Australozyma saopauloensis]|uniref:Protein BFR2 n=1 Tax=Australozyma saopauloensis TaxID=291208 RepID=A0AAX4H597_9ASCO|nr:hypothetical protein PUMCH_001002 [[Candida] saopauloensis]